MIIIYDDFGNTTSYAEEVSNRFMYAGEQFDKITGQYYLRARYYDPTVGRFTQEDTYRGDGFNLYAYVANNPLKYVDPSGYCKSNISLKEIENMAVNEIKAQLDELLEDTYNAGWPIWSQVLGNESMSKYLYDSYLAEVSRLRAFNSITRGVDFAELGKTIYESYEEAIVFAKGEPRLTFAGTVALIIIKEAFDVTDPSDPSVSEFLKATGLGGYLNRRISTALIKYEYAKNSDYKYLLVASSAQKELINQLNIIKNQIKEQDEGRFDYDYQNRYYKQKIINYIDHIINLNTNFYKSRDELYDKAEEYLQ